MEVSVEQSQIRPLQISEKGTTQAHATSLKHVATRLHHIAGACML
jgi:hypothetical protein